jgi:hypothetical protein
MPRFDAEAINDLFSYHAPNDEQRGHYEAIRDAAKTFALVLVEHTPQSADQSAAIRHLRECVHTANGSIALEGKF